MVCAGGARRGGWQVRSGQSANKGQSSAEVESNCKPCRAPAETSLSFIETKRLSNQATQTTFYHKEKHAKERVQTRGLRPGDRSSANSKYAYSKEDHPGIESRTPANSYPASFLRARKA